MVNNKEITVVVSNTFSPSEINRMQKECPDYVTFYATDENNPDMNLLTQADIIIGFFTPEAVSQCPRLQWLQLTVVGFEKYILPGITPRQATITNARGAFGQEVSEHMFAVLLSLLKKLEIYRDNQTKHVWHDEGMVRTLTNATVLIVGAGSIGTAFAQLCSALGAHCIGFRRHIPDDITPFEKVTTLDHLHEYVGQADVVASFLPYSEETTDLFNSDFFAAMKHGSYFLNGGRGNSVVLHDLASALIDHHLAGAGLDVFVHEPLSADSELWDVPHLIVTPHIAGNIRGDFHLYEAAEKTTDLACANLRAWFAHEPLTNLIR